MTDHGFLHALAGSPHPGAHEIRQLAPDPDLCIRCERRPASDPDGLLCDRCETEQEGVTS